MKEINMPPSRACEICRNRMNDVCLECAKSQDFKDFRPDMKRPLEKLPTLTFEEYLELPGPMKGKWLFVLSSKIVEAINEQQPSFRQNHDYPRSRRLSQTFKEQSLLFSLPEENSPLPASKECEDIRK